ncbi:MAG TPA: choice-of-anchor Q domain-containing protein [Bacteroidales bacterium]|nr:choice-of-anchor Q domain-containing protein [Bacteroidales bacterium]HPS16907.1 choice-of-anchor Q domain-containing protein [Bacteroidales bacterium]
MKGKSIQYIPKAFLFIMIFVVITITSCKKEKLITDSSAKLQFSTDTLIFDTVFTTIGSITRQVKVYNPYDNKINISNIRLAGNTNSQFSINIDGVATTNLSEIQMEAKDSIYIFVKVTVDPNNSNSPFVISDSILFETNGNLQKVQLVAWGQNAYYHTPKYPTSNPWYSVIPCDAVWTNDKPHVIYGYAVVDSACTLTIKENTKVYLHNNAVLWIYRDGSLNIEGTLGNPVIFQGDRLESYYQDVPGQWSRIWISRGSKNKIDHAIIKNGIVGIHVDTLGDNCNEPALKISNTIIENMSAAGMYFQGTWIEAENCVIGNCGQYGVILNIGGKYDFKHCTIGNYWTQSNRQTPSLVLNNWYEDINGITQYRDLEKAYFGNCIIYGTVDDELYLDKKSGALFNYNFDHCLIKTKLDTAASFTANCLNCFFNQNPDFTDVSATDYSLNSTSPAINKGALSIANYVPFDILRHNRTTNTAPDIGAYEKE